MNADTVAKAISTPCEWSYAAESGQSITLRVCSSGLLKITASNPDGVFMSRREGYKMWRKMKVLFPTEKGKAKKK